MLFTVPNRKFRPEIPSTSLRVFLLDIRVLCDTVRRPDAEILLEEQEMTKQIPVLEYMVVSS